MKKRMDTRKVDEIIESLSDMKRAEPPPFFYTRLQARMMKPQKSLWESLGGIVGRPAVALLSISLVVLLDTFVIFSESSKTSTSHSTEMAVADEYHQTASIYDLENVAP